MDCEHCGARDGETFKAFRMRKSLVAPVPSPELDNRIFHVKATEHGNLCLWCAIHKREPSSEVTDEDVMEAIRLMAVREE